ncbi:hypothetical protein [Clostridium oryzae]|uniref:Uncharacterized protein n=1 Tax=Clostridium oryzae TaxID=1450648 RepID=A0A1V4IES7_9CLOT|nr:hypothetical protein [Clostridium oryzae]OPJ58429.1 hypothetical protein CLORY_35790 [Clostridium oryzae]
MAKYINKQIVEEKQSESDKDMVIADLTTQLANDQQQISDMSMIVADLQVKVGGTK